MIIDTHIHERTYSLDSELELRQIVMHAQQLGLDGICITDHENNQIQSKAKRLSQELDYPIFVGAEILTYEGDILCFGLDQLPTKKMHCQDLINLVNKNKGTTISAHPYRINNRGLKDRLLEVKGLGAIEAFNGSTSLENNIKAMKVANALGIPISGASDAHKPNKIGVFATLFPNGVRNTKDLIEAIKSKQIKPVFHQNKEYQEISKYIESSHIFVG